MLSELTGATDTHNVSRQSSNSDISITHQGWHNDLMTAMAAESRTQNRRTGTHITPFRDRIKTLAASSRRRHDHEDTFRPPTVIASASLSNFHYNPVHPAKPQIDAEPESASLVATNHESTSLSGKKTWGEAIYKVGYERMVLDTEARLHETMCNLIGSHVFAKLENPPKRVLDLGTGLGLWPIAQSQVWPNTRFVGLDRIPCQLDLGVLKRTCKMGNMSWIQSDFLEPLPFKDDYFGYIHIRFIGLGVSEHHWTSLLEECCRILERGGKIEIVETSYDLPQAPVSLQNSFASLLLADLVAESPAHAINFTLPMLPDIKPSSIHPVYSQTFTHPPGALRDAATIWISSSLDYKVSCKLQGGTLAQVNDELRWSEDSGKHEDQPIRLWIWVLEKTSM